jgi:hypothetical protein
LIRIFERFEKEVPKKISQASLLMIYFFNKEDPLIKCPKKKRKTPEYHAESSSKTPDW